MSEITSINPELGTTLSPSGKKLSMLIAGKKEEDVIYCDDLRIFHESNLGFVFVKGEITRILNLNYVMDLRVENYNPKTKKK